MKTVWKTSRGWGAIALSAWVLCVRGAIVDPADYGFSPDAPAATNAVALQRALDGGKRTVQVTRPGVYGLDRTVWLDSDTRLIFTPGAVLQKQAAYVHVLANRGLESWAWDTNIVVEGATIDVNDFSAGHGEDSPQYGNRGQISFCRIRDLTVRKFTCLNLHGGQYGFQIATFENVILDEFEIRGAKDGVHVNAGRKFVIRNGILETGDDGIALTAMDWVSSAPVVGDIEDGLIENITDDGRGRCNFSRILTGAWTDWHKGIRLQRGDTVRCGKKLYRVAMPRGTNEYVSLEAPTHTRGIWTDATGLKFWFMQDSDALAANIRNVTFRNLYLRSPRNGFLADWETRSSWNRGIHPEVKPENYPVCEVRLEDVYSESPGALVSGYESVRLWLRNITKTRGPLVNLARPNDNRDCAIDVWLHLSGVVLKADDGKGADISVGGAGSSLNLTVEGLMQERDLRVSAGAGVRARVNGIGSIHSLEGLTPEAGDSIKVGGVLKTFDGTQWR
ncbi:MAG TPA: hypothetical protein PLH01_07025 [Kiritimatiellia bacterium]|nr:hypothetical protein [Kiritimatiellia bacterium]HOR97154.1 hypothetical protein [Kiritimatiellia bacterium]HPK38016.1 hypothetical protein [Kiritimatiellia bacterium]